MALPVLARPQREFFTPRESSPREMIDSFRHAWDVKNKFARCVVVFDALVGSRQLHRHDADHRQARAARALPRSNNTRLPIVNAKFCVGQASTRGEKEWWVRDGKIFFFGAIFWQKTASKTNYGCRPADPYLNRTQIMSQGHDDLCRSVSSARGQQFCWPIAR
jgi:hypothetical protein